MLDKLWHRTFHVLVILFIWGLFGGPNLAIDHEYGMSFAILMIAALCWAWIWERDTADRWRQAYDSFKSRTDG